MPQFIIFLIIGVVGIVIGRYLAVRNKARKVRGKNIIEQQKLEKAENKRRILALLRTRLRKGENAEIRNDEVEKLLGVSDATAERYLDELEKEGNLKQVGRTGHHTYYKVL